MKTSAVMDMLAKDLLLESRSDDEFTVAEYIDIMKQKTGRVMSRASAKRILDEKVKSGMLISRRTIIVKSLTELWRYNPKYSPKK